MIVAKETETKSDCQQKEKVKRSKFWVMSIEGASLDSFNTPYNIIEGQKTYQRIQITEKRRESQTLNDEESYLQCLYIIQNGKDRASGEKELIGL